MKLFVIILGLFVAGNCWARISDGQVKMDLAGKNLIVKVSPGFHLNKEAPASLIAGKLEQAPSKKEEAEIVFSTEKVKGPFKISFYVCDDKKTVCEEHVYDYQIQAGKLVETKPAAKVSEPAVAKVKPQKIVYNSHGFIADNLEGALAKAKKEKKLLFVDFGAPWCPACVRLETEVFGTKVFKNATKKVVKLALNSDILQNKAFGEKYQIKVLPTMLILNAEGEELYRDINFRPAAELSADLAVQIKQKGTQWAKVEKEAEAGDKAAMKKMAERALSAFNMEEALKWHAKIQEMNHTYAYVETSFWAEKDLKDEKNRKDYIDILKKWIAFAPDSYAAMSARNAWAEVYGEKSLPSEVTAELKRNITLAKTLVEDPAATRKLFTDWGVSRMAPYEKEEIFDLWMTSAKALKEDTKEIKERLQASLKAKDLSLSRPGEVLEGLSYFRKADLTKEEEAWLLKFAEAEPKSYVHHMKLASFYKRQKDFAKALPAAQKAVELSEQRRLGNLQMLAQIQKELNLKEDAKKSIERALALPEVKMEKYKAMVTSLEELKKSL